MNPVILDKALVALHRHYGDRYTIRHNGGLWVATTTDHDSDAAPTVIEEDLARFLAALEFPAKRADRPTGITSAHP